MRSVKLVLRAARRRSHSSSVRTHAHRLEIAVGTLDFLAEPCRRHVPDPQPVIRVVPAHEPRSVGAESQARHDAGVRQARTGLAGRRIPKAHLFVPSPRSKPASVRAEGDRVDIAAVTAQHGKVARGSTSQTRTVPSPAQPRNRSALSEASRWPRGANARSVTDPVWPSRTAMSSPPADRHTRIVRSVPAEAIHWPSGL